MKVMITWLKVKPALGPSYEKGMVGKVQMFWLSPDVTNMSKYVLHVLLPGYSGRGCFSENLEDLKDAAEKRLAKWLSDADLTVKDAEP